MAWVIPINMIEDDQYLKMKVEHTVLSLLMDELIEKLCLTCLRRLQQMAQAVKEAD